HGDQILENCATNVCPNSAIFNSQAAVHRPKADSKYGSQKRLKIVGFSVLLSFYLSLSLSLSFHEPFQLEKLPLLSRKSNYLIAMPFRFSWTISEIEEAQRASLLLAADVIYSDDFTDALVSTLEAIMSQGPDNIPQSMREHDRGNDVELWQIRDSISPS
ncbi:hypothetical protein RJ641_020014, partial [Dillenia turbinata]